jgi:ABC-type polysaccharide/polyol phosphate export permease
MTESQTARALRDLREAACNPHLWLLLGWQDIRQRYRRSYLGPFWLTISTAMMVVALGLLYAAIFRQPLEDYLPFLATGLVIWTFIAGIVADGCNAFIAADGIIKQIRVPFATLALRSLWRNLVIFGHNAVIIVAVVALYGRGQSVATLALLVPAMALVLANGLWVTLVLGLFCARFRDVPLIVANIMQLMFFLTPILWQPSLLPGRTAFVQWNPLHHFVEILRAPFLGEFPPASSWLAAGAITAAGWALCFVLFRRYRGRIAYWL